jgi:uncharacterized protein YwgA
MDRQLVVLKRFVEAMGEPADISSIDARKRFQKAVYLGQVAGVDLGYRYGWYVRGPYSPPLANHYYKLSQAIATKQAAPTNIILKPEAKKTLENLKSLLKLPQSVKLDPSEWYELLASWHFLLTVSKKDRKAALETMERQKEPLVPFIEVAEAKLKEHKLL